MKLGYIRKSASRSVEAQQDKLLSAGVDVVRVYVEGRDDETLAACIGHLRDGDTLCVCRVSLLAEPKRKRTDPPPRETLREIIKTIKAKDATVFEVDTGRSCTDQDHLYDMIFDAVDELASGGKGRASRRNSRSSKGRPRIEWTDEQLRVMQYEFESVEHVSERAASAAIGQRLELDMTVAAIQSHCRRLAAMNWKQPTQEEKQ